MRWVKYIHYVDTLNYIETVQKEIKKRYRKDFFMNYFIPLYDEHFYNGYPKTKAALEHFQKKLVHRLQSIEKPQIIGVKGWK